MLTIHETLEQGSEADYHAHPALSSGIAKTILNKSPRHAKYERENKRESSRAQDIGSLLHGMVLGFGEKPVLYPEDCYKKDGSLNGKPAGEFRGSLAADQVAVKPSDLVKLEGMVESAREALASVGIEIDPRNSELQAYTEIDGLEVRAMFDYIPADSRLPIIDLKKTQDASPKATERTMAQYGYDFQCEWYGDIYKQIAGQDRQFLFLFIEEEAPHAWSFAEPDFMTREINQRRCAEARRIWKECLASGVYPGYEGRVTQYQMPAWQANRILEGME